MVFTSSTGGLSHTVDEDTPEPDLEQAIEAFGDVARARDRTARLSETDDLTQWDQPSSATTRTVRSLRSRRAADAAAVVERGADVVEGLRGQALARQHVRDSRRVGGQSLRGDPPGGLLGRHDLLGAEEGLARREHELAPGRWRGEGLVSAMVRLFESVHGVPERLHQALAALPHGLGHAEHGDHHVLAEELEVHVVALAQERCELVSGRARAAHVDRQAERVVGMHAGGPDQPLVEHVQARDGAHLLAQLRQPRERFGEQLAAPRPPPVAARHQASR